MKIESGLSKDEFRYKIYHAISDVVSEYSPIDEKHYNEDECYLDPMIYSQMSKYLYSTSTDDDGDLSEDKLWDNIRDNTDIDYLYGHYLNNPHFADGFVVIFEKKHLPVWLDKKEYMAYWSR